MKKLLSLLIGVMLVCSFGVCEAESDVSAIAIDITNLEGICGGIKGTITLTEGWNLIAMPVLPVQPYSVQQFQKAVAASGWNVAYSDINETSEDINIVPIRPSNWQIPVVAVYKNGQFERYPKEGVSYNMVPGEAYFVYANYNGPRAILDPVVNPDGSTSMPPAWHPTTTVTITGKPLDAPVSLNLNRGWNAAAIAPIDRFPNLNEKSELSLLRLFRTYDLSRELEEQQVKATRVVFWRADQQEWEQYALPLPVYTQPDPGEIHTMNYPMECQFIRSIRPDEGFFLLTEENGLYIPGLNTQTVPEPPVPPFPEEIVNYTGKVSIMYDVPCPYRLECADGTIVPLRGKDAQIDQAIAEAAGQHSTEFTVTGSFAVVDLENPWTGEPVKMKVLVVSKIASASEHVSYTGRLRTVEGVPYGLQLVCEDGIPIPLKGTDEAITEQLTKGLDGALYTIEGVFTIVDARTMYPPFDPIKVKVLLVDTVIRLGFLQ